PYPRGSSSGCPWGCPSSARRGPSRHSLPARTRSSRPPTHEGRPTFVRAPSWVLFELDLEFLDLVDLDALHAGQSRADLLERGIVAELLHLLEAGRVGQQLAERDVEHRDFLAIDVRCVRAHEL